MGLGVENNFSIAAAGAAESEATVFIIDDDVSTRNSLIQLVTLEGWRAESFVSAEQFLSSPAHSGPSCLVLEVALPGLSGLELQRLLTARSEIPMIFVTARQDPATVVQAMKAGAAEFLIKPFRDDAFVGAVRDAMERSRVAARAQSEVRMFRQCYACLSRREREVMSLVVSGLLNKEVGGELGISEITVKAHRASVMRKMRAASLPDLVRMATRLGLPLVPTLGGKTGSCIASNRVKFGMAVAGVAPSMTYRCR